LKRINHLKKRKSVEIGIARANAPDSMLAHKNCRMRVVKQIAGQVWQFRNDLSGDIGVSIGCNENAETWRSK